MSIHAPYNFVPLNTFVHLPQHAETVSRDIPFQNGLCGSLDLKITNHTPFLVGGKQNKATADKAGDVFFAKRPDGTPTIPGTSLRGMLRNTLEIAAFGKMRLADDRRLSIRDLTGGTADIYRVKMNKTRGFGPRSKGGWLRLRQENGDTWWELTPCDWARVDHDLLIDYAKEQKRIRNPGRIKEKQQAFDKYKTWGDGLNISFDLPREDPRDKGKGSTPKHLIACNLGRGSMDGRLVFTGQPQKNDSRKYGKSRPKHLEFLFHDERAPFKVDDDVMQGFLDIHGETEEWQHWKPQLGSGMGVPIFYITETEQAEDQNVLALGLAMMFRLAYRYGIGEMIEHTNWKHRDENGYDLVELIFGTINANNKGLAGRVSFGPASPSKEISWDKPQKTLLNGPKPSYFPAYVKQPDMDERGVISRGRYRTCMDKDGEISGWKRYPVRKQADFTTADHGLEAKSEKVFQMLHPMATGNEFRAKMRFHNLLPEELGALIWAITLGGDEARFHALGMGKPFGMGRVSITVEGSHFICNDLEMQAPTPEDCRLRFEEHMQEAWQKEAGTESFWLESNQITQLLAMADPEQKGGQPGKLTYMSLKEFQNKKGRGKGDPRFALLPYTAWEGPADEDLFARETREQAEEAAKERVKKAEIEAELSVLTPLARELKTDLESSNAEDKANLWLAKLDEVSEEDGRQIAEGLFAFYEPRGKWGKNVSKKQKPKNQKIKSFLES